MSPNCEPVLIQRTITLPRSVKDLPKVDVRPYLDPLRLEVAVQRLAEFVRGGLVFPVCKEDLTKSEVYQRSVAIRFGALSRFRE